MPRMLLFLLCLSATGSRLAGQSILHYHAVLLRAEPLSGGPAQLAIRSFTRDTTAMLLLVHPDSLNLYAAPARDFCLNPANWNGLRAQWGAKPYFKALTAARQLDAPLQDAGIVHLPGQEPGIDLTADLCPARLPLDRRVFDALIQMTPPAERPAPITLSISGRWLQTHHDDLEWLKMLVQKGDLAITWANHSLNHFWNKNLPLDENFLLEKGTDLETEVLGNEELMLENGILPSLFFRFPGLVSDRAIVDRLLDWGLIPIGSDAWLAKGQHPKSSGSIVLIHANGNEPLGVAEFIRLLQSEKTALYQGKWRLLDLREELQKE